MVICFDLFSELNKGSRSIWIQSPIICRISNWSEQSRYSQVLFSFLISKDTRYAVIQIHYNNPGLLPNQTDSSGIRMFTIPKDPLRVDAGFIFLGVNNGAISIPPNKTAWHISGNCTVPGVVTTLHKLISSVTTRSYSSFLCSWLPYAPIG